uniref:Uncharacterized protein n=1 Tax=Knipowitschia caucasica TaxID=637954 RepID=A0AAV2LSY2_KNICA
MSFSSLRAHRKPQSSQRISELKEDLKAHRGPQSSQRISELTEDLKAHRGSQSSQRTSKLTEDFRAGCRGNPAVRNEKGQIWLRRDGERARVIYAAQIQSRFRENSGTSLSNHSTQFITRWTDRTFWEKLFFSVGDLNLL